MFASLLSAAPWLALLPPLIAISLALWKKDVIVSLVAGFFFAALLMANFDLLKGIMYFFTTLAEQVGGNVSVLVFGVLLGWLLVLIGRSGGSEAYGSWAARKLKTKKAVLVSTSVLGVALFIDDYFNCLTIGSIMRPVTDKMKISRAKLAYVLDSTAAPVCIIAPLSNWALAVAAYIESSAPAGVTLSGMSLFVQSIPYDLYALLTIIMIFFLAGSGIDFGPMKRYEANAQAGDVLTDHDLPQAEEKTYVPSPRGRVKDLIIPLAVLILGTVFFMIYTGCASIALETGGYENALAVPFTTAWAVLFKGQASLGTILGSCSSANSMVAGSALAIIVAILMYVPRKLVSFKDCMSSLADGWRAFVPAMLILSLSWGLVQACRDLGTATFITDLVARSGLSLSLVPMIIFIIAAGISFATGTSWGTFGLLLIFVVPLLLGEGNLLVIGIAATLAGSVMGDHISPISDTTILASTGANCNHVAHVKTQLPYALVVGAVSMVGFLVAGLTRSLLWTWLVSLVLLPVLVLSIHALDKKHEAKA